MVTGDFLGAEQCKCYRGTTVPEIKITTINKSLWYEWIRDWTRKQRYTHTGEIRQRVRQ